MYMKQLSRFTDQLSSNTGSMRWQRPLGEQQEGPCSIEQSPPFRTHLGGGVTGKRGTSTSSEYKEELRGKENFTHPSTINYFSRILKTYF